MGRNKLDYEFDRVVLQVPKELKEEIKKELKPIVKKKVDKWKKNR
jgi:hypothetical protein